MKWILILMLTAGSSAFACPGTYVTLNDDSILTAAGLVDASSGSLISVQQMNTQIIAGETPAHRLGDSQGVYTHTILYLGSVADEGGIVQSSYLVKEGDAEKVYVLRSNYMGNGLTARETRPQGQSPESPLKPSKKFQSLFTSGCR